MRDTGTAPAEPTTVEKLRGLPWSIASNCANTVYAQFTFFGSAFVLFLSALSMSKAQIGLLLSFIPFAGLIALFIAPAVARFGYKRTYITFFGLRKVVTIGLLFTPWVLDQFGGRAVIVYVTGIVALFALTRSVAETGVYPWLQEYIPNSVRGKYSAINSVYTTVIGLAAVGVAGYVIGRATDYTGYMALIAVGILFGFLSVWLATRIPGGAPERTVKVAASPFRGMGDAMRDANFTRYLLGAALIIIGTGPMISFLPLFMQEEVGLTEGSIVLLQAGVLIGTLLSSFAWGWAADRYGSKPIMLSNLWIKVLLPLLWLLMPRSEPTNLVAAMAIAVLLGVSDIGWGIGAARLLFVSVVPPAHKNEYMALHYAWVGVIGGASQLLGGRLLDVSSGLQGQVLGLSIDPYTPLFLISFVCTAGSLAMLRHMRADNVYGVAQFAGMFLRGNPFLAMSALIRYQWARDERSAVETTERLGQAKSPLAVDELLETLKDPRFNVRYEAIISIARMRPEPRLTQALIRELNGTELALSAAAAWALGRLGDPKGVEPLRAALDSDYLSIRGQSARALGALGDSAVVPLLLARLETEQNKGLQMAYASALGNLRATAAAPQVLALLDHTQNEGARMELGLALARLVGDEHDFIQRMRSVREDPGTSIAQALIEFARTLRRSPADFTPLAAQVDAASDAFAHDRMDRGAALLAEALSALPADHVTPTGALILAACASSLVEPTPPPTDILILALHTLAAAWQPQTH